MNEKFDNSLLLSNLSNWNSSPETNEASTGFA